MTKRKDRQPEREAKLKHSSIASKQPKRFRKRMFVDCGWGRLIFGQTYSDNADLVEVLRGEGEERRDIAIYLRDPHVVISLAPQELFLDPSHTYRLWLDRYKPSKRRPRGFDVRGLEKRAEASAVHNLYLQRHMVPPGAAFVWGKRKSKLVTYLIAIDERRRVLGAVAGIDHVEAFGDPENGSSLWALATDPQARPAGIGEMLTRRLAEIFLARGRRFMDLSVLHDNHQAIQLYEKLGFERIPVFAVKKRNAYNEPLFVGEAAEDSLNPYAQIIVREAKRRGIYVEVLDAEGGFFELSSGGRSVVCRESLSELTTAVAMSRCDDKAVTHRILRQAGLRVPAQTQVKNLESAKSFLDRCGSVVVKPARGEQGAGISVDVRTVEALDSAIRAAEGVSDRVILEQYVEGADLRIIVINYQVVAAAVRRPAEIVGTGRDSIRALIEKQSRRREAATQGESHIPTDAETERCIANAGYALEDTLPEGETLQVRKTANLHTGGTIHDVTERLNPKLAQAAEDAARSLNIPVTGLDFIVPSVEGPDYFIIEANERPGLANHEPQPTAERFVDLLFPETVYRSHRA